MRIFSNVDFVISICSVCNYGFGEPEFGFLCFRLAPRRGDDTKETGNRLKVFMTNVLWLSLGLRMLDHRKSGNQGDAPFCWGTNLVNPASVAGNFGGCHEQNEPVLLIFASGKHNTLRNAVGTDNKYLRCFPQAPMRRGPSAWISNEKQSRSFMNDLEGNRCPSTGRLT